MKFYGILSTLSMALALVTASPTPRQGEAVKPLSIVEASASSSNTTGTALTTRSNSLDWDWTPIVFDNGVPVGGWAHLSIRDDGSYTFSGHFHDSGATSYNMGLVWAVKDARNVVYTFQNQCRVHGTFEAGSRDCDWNVNGNNNDIASHWGDIAASWTYNVQAAADFDFFGLLNAVLDALGKAIGVVAAVIAIV